MCTTPTRACVGASPCWQWVSPEKVHIAYTGNEGPTLKLVYRKVRTLHITVIIMSTRGAGLAMSAPPGLWLANDALPGPLAGHQYILGVSGWPLALFQGLWLALGAQCAPVLCAGNPSHLT